MIVTQLWLVLSGNFAWLNWLTIILAVSAIDHSVVRVGARRCPTRRRCPAAPLWFAAW